MGLVSHGVTVEDAEYRKGKVTHSRAIWEGGVENIHT